MRIPRVASGVALVALAAVCAASAAPTRLLQPVSGEELAACAKLRGISVRRLERWRVVCPALVPWSSAGSSVDYAGGALSTSGFGAGYAIDVMGWYGHPSASGGHWAFVSGDPKLVEAYFFPRDAGGALFLGTSTSYATICGMRDRVLRVPSGGMHEFSGHVGVASIIRGQVYIVSIHGWMHEQQALAMSAALIRQVRGRC
jgi:hypothetical protein